MPQRTDLTKQFEQAYRKGNFSEAAEISAALAADYEACGDLLSAAEMKNNRSVALLKNGQAADALAAAEGSDEIFAAAGDSRRQAFALGNQAAALEALGKLDQAAERYRRSAGLLKSSGEHELHAIVMKSLSAVYMRQGKQMDTVIALQASLENDDILKPREKFIKKFLRRLLALLP